MPRAVPGLYLVRFAFPILPEWTQDLRACGVETIVYLGNSTYLARAAGLETIGECKAAKRLEWAGPFLTTDRVSPETLREAAELGEREYELQFLPGTMNGDAADRLPARVEVLETSQVIPGGPIVILVRAGRAALDELVDTSPDLLTILPWSPAQLSDERQGQIIARNVDANGYPIISPHYYNWLTDRGLNTAANQQTVAVFDTGYDDGTLSPGPPDFQHHPDLWSPQRLIAARNYVPGENDDVVADNRGHGTMVAGIIAGKGVSPFWPSIDSQLFFRGEGIAPQAKLVAIKVLGSGDPNCNTINTGLFPSILAQAFDFARRNANNTADLALIANHSWNGGGDYDTRAQLMDQRVIDAYHPEDGVLHPMTVVVSADNSGPAADTVSTPGTAKNVITVGSTQSYRPDENDPPLSCTTGPPTEPATNPSAVSSFSSRGFNFGPGTGSEVRTTRVKPDLVAPGGRVTSTVPYQNDGTTGDTYRCAALCQKYYPAGSYYTYAQGTSFAAPVVSGAAALARKWLLDQGVTSPSPSLVKAALIATADDLPNGGDHRPSNDQGWGRVNIDRLTESSPKLAINEDPANEVRTGDVVQVASFRIVDGAKPTFVALVWNDPPNATTYTTSQFPLINDLRLELSDGGQKNWYSNLFHENISGVDDGYSYMYDTKILPPGDTINNVEAIFVPPGIFATGDKLTVEVIGENVTTASPQQWSLFAYNAQP